MTESKTTAGPSGIFQLDGISSVIPAMRDGDVAGGISNDADARLIAAAPELLAACKAMLEWVERRPKTHPFDAWNMARLAVAKAEGSNT